MYAASRAAADKSDGVYVKTKFPEQIMMQLGVAKPLVFEPSETLTQYNYIDDVLPLALSEGERLIGNKFIFPQDNASPHAVLDSQAWCAGHFPHFIDSKRWPADSPDQRWTSRGVTPSRPVPRRDGTQILNGEAVAVYRFNESAVAVRWRSEFLAVPSISGPDLNTLDCYVWNTINQRMRWNNVRNYQILKQEIK